jgi:alkylated DNA nucleotide flippase Atl1
MKSFQEKILRIVQKIPEGEVLTYKAVSPGDKVGWKSWRIQSRN